MTALIISSTALIIIVLTLRHFLKGHISLRLQYALWALVLLRLLIPFNLPQSPISVLNAVDTSKAAIAFGEEPMDQVLLHDVFKPTAQTAEHTSPDLNAAPETHNPTLDWAQAITLVWYTGIALVGLTLLLSNLSFSRKLRKTRVEFPAGDYSLRVYVVENLPTPCLYGLFTPAVYMTPEVAQDETKRRHVLAHELRHYRHGDHIWSALRSLCLAVYWFNPFVWLAAAISRRDAELACDEATISRLGEEHRLEYGRTLIGLTCQKRSKMDLLCCATTMIDSKKGLQERIVLIAKKPKTALCTLMVTLLILAVGAGCTFTDSTPVKTAQPTATPLIEDANYVGNSGVTVSDSKLIYTVYDGQNPLSKEELQQAKLLTLINVDSLDFLREAPNLTHIRTSCYSASTIDDAKTVYGDISALGELTNLQSILLSYSNVTGDISALSGLEQLQEVQLGDTHVTGDISALNKLVNLRAMYLDSDNITGNLDALDGMPALENLGLSGSGIKGSLSSLGALPNLNNLSLYAAPNITGTISMIKEMHLTGIHFIETGIAIDLSDLTGVSSLYTIELISDNITGNLSALSGMSDLISIYLGGKNIEGDLNALGGLKDLHIISLLSTPKITGDISALKGCDKMLGILLEDTNITADLSDLSEFPGLMFLTATSSNISGNLGDLSGLENLSSVQLASPDITGDLTALDSIRNLSRLKLRCPGVTGDMDTLSKYRKLTYIDLSTANVTGDIGALTNLKLLFHLDLSSTGVSGDLSALDGLTMLRDIDVTDTTVTGQ